jgi:hypothetical protein
MIDSGRRIVVIVHPFKPRRWRSLISLAISLAVI